MQFKEGLQASISLGHVVSILLLENLVLQCSLKNFQRSVELVIDSFA